MNSHALPEGSGGQAVPPRDGAAVRFCSVSAVRTILPRLRHFLTGEETARLGTYRQDPDRERFLLGRALLRLFAGDILGVQPQAVPLQFTSTGKPVITDCGLHFNVSHSGDVVALAFAERPVGIDVEAIAEAVPWEAMTIAFSPNERAQLSRLAGDERRRGFYEIWARKEALLKADGRGLHDDLPSVETMRSDGSWHPTVRLGEATFRLVAIAAPPGAVAAVATCGHTGRIEPLAVTAGHLRILADKFFEQSRAGDGPVSLPRCPRSPAAPAGSAARSG